MFEDRSSLKKSFSFLKQQSLLTKIKWDSSMSCEADLHVLSSSRLSKELKSLLHKWQIQKWSEARSALMCFETSKGLLWILCGSFQKVKKKTYSKMLGDPSSDHTFFRDQAGLVFKEILKSKVTSLSLHLDVKLKSSSVKALFSGFEICSYNFQPHKSKCPQIVLSSKKTFKLEKLVQQATFLGQSVNLAKHLVNLPAEILNPITYAEVVKWLFQKHKSISVQIWDETDLKKENMNLVLAVGRAGSTPPRVIKLSYRPSSQVKKQLPIVLVGKGVTYDTGGLNIKPGNAMRIMKKDMGGSASLVGLMWWLKNSKLKCAVDVYLGLAENSISASAFRPGDILKSKKGLTVEIDNTDAEGRLVLADVLTLAQQKPLKALVDVATLTGAIKASLGLQVAGLFSNHHTLCDTVFKASQEAGDELWPMPLVEAMKPELNSSVADLVNSSSSAGGGAVSAALFLEAFVEANTPWAHLDIFAWTTNTNKVHQHIGGSGQGVQCLAFWLEKKPWQKKF